MSFTLVMLPRQAEQTKPNGWSKTATWGTRLADDLEDVVVVETNTDDEAIKALQDGAEAAYGVLPLHLLQHAWQLRWLQSPWAGPPAGYFYPELCEHPVTITNVRGTYKDHLAAHTLMLILALSRGLGPYIRQQVEHQWIQHDDPASITHLPESTVLIVGLGEVGRELARLLAPFACELLATDARPSDIPPGVNELHRADDLDNLLPRADIVVVTVPHTPETNRLIDEKRLAVKMKPSAFLLNVGRGPVVDVDAVAAAIVSGRLGGAALDVFPTEPLPTDHPLWDLPQVLITPHVAGIGPYLDDRMYGVLLENARRFGQNQPLINVVDKATWF